MSTAATVAAVTAANAARNRAVVDACKFTDEERARIAAGAKVMLIVPGSTMMPAALEVEP